MTERERLLLYEMIKMARGKLIEMGNADFKRKEIPLTDFINESSLILGALEEIYGTPRKTNELEK